MNEQIKNAIESIKEMPFEEKIGTINEIKKLLKQISPFSAEPVECVQWVKSDEVIANDYNPNSVAPPEMELLHTSIQEDGYTQQRSTAYEKYIEMMKAKREQDEGQQKLWED